MATLTGPRVAFVPEQCAAVERNAASGASEAVDQPSRGSSRAEEVLRAPGADLSDRHADVRDTCVQEIIIEQTLIIEHSQ